jgi:hypothetical protein
MVMQLLPWVAAGATLWLGSVPDQVQSVFIRLMPPWARVRLHASPCMMPSTVWSERVQPPLAPGPFGQAVVKASG